MRLLRSLEAVYLSRIIVKKPCKCAKYILTCPLWLQIYVSIVHRSIKTWYSPYGRHITYDVLLIFPRFFDKCKPEILYQLCNKNDLRDLIKIHYRFGWSRDDVEQYYIDIVLQLACRHGNLNMAKWLYTVLQLTVDDVRFSENQTFKHACKYGNLDMAQWLYTTFQLTVDDARSEDNYAFRHACIYGYLDVAQWLYTTFQLTVDDARVGYNETRLKSRQNVCDWLVATFGVSVIV